jgi:hypothetical protein
MFYYVPEVLCVIQLTDPGNASNPPDAKLHELTQHLRNSVLVHQQTRRTIARTHQALTPQAILCSPLQSISKVHALYFSVGVKSIVFAFLTEEGMIVIAKRRCNSPASSHACESASTELLGCVWIS